MLEKTSTENLLGVKNLIQNEKKITTSVRFCKEKVSKSLFSYMERKPMHMAEAANETSSTTKSSLRPTHL